MTLGSQLQGNVAANSNLLVNLFDARDLLNGNSKPVLHPLRVKQEAPKAPAAASAPAKTVEATEDTNWVEICLKDKEGNGIPFAKVEIAFDCGDIRMLRTNEFGIVRIDGLTATTKYKVRLVRS